MESVENVDANPRWRMPRRGMVKINVHGCFLNEPLPNGNISGIRAFIRNSRGKILRMLFGSLEIQNQRQNEFQAFLEGGAHPNHADLVQQLNQRKTDPNFNMEPTLCDTNANGLAIFLDHHGAQNYKSMVVIAQPFGEIFELWSRDMGLGSADPRFMAVNEEDILPVVDNNGEDAALELVDGGLMNAEDEMVEVIAIDDD
ncbi:hypothetical protein ACET3Z_002820 [Daucus carota]